MGVGAILGGVGALSGIASSISGMTGGPGGGGGYYSGAGTPMTYIPGNQPGADAQYYNLASQMAQGGPQLSNYVFPTAMGLTQDVISNPYASGIIQGATTAGSYGTSSLAPMQTAGAQTLQGLGNTAAQYAPQILQTGFDPQQALYDRTRQQVQDQANAINAMYGLGSSPYGAGVANQAMSNFNIDWQNQQLQRQLQAAQGYSGLETAAGRGFAGASDLGAAGQQTYLTSGAMPYQAQQGIYGTQLGALGNLNQIGTGAYGLDQNTLNALAAYMRLGQGATGQAISAGGQAFDQQQRLGQQFGQNIQALSDPLSQLFGGGGTNSGSYGWGLSPYVTGTATDPLSLINYGGQY